MSNDFRAEWDLVGSNAKCVVIRDVADPTKRSITNDAENVVADLRQCLRGRRLFYYDTMNVLDELVVDDQGRFAGFKPGPETNPLTGGI